MPAEEEKNNATKDTHTYTSSEPTGFKKWLPDFLASLVVFLVALPLCIGIAVACGVPAERGLVSGIVGGIIVGIFAGSPLLVTGPAASLIVPVYDLIQQHGILALGPVVMLAGIWQLLAGIFGLGQWFRAVAPAVIIGMLVGIGLLIFSSQLHVAVDSDTQASLWQNLVTFPGAVLSNLKGDYAGLCAMGVGIGTIVLLILWTKFRPKQLKLVPGHLVALVTVSVVTFLFELPVRFLDISPNFVEALVPVHTVDLQSLANPSILGKSLMFAFVASAATLLTASAIDQKQNHTTTDYNKEMIAQGIGNIVTGGVGGLPMTGVIVRSSVNVDAGALSRKSAILHGFWILGFVMIAPEVLERIPRSALGAILVYTGYKLSDIKGLKALYQRGRGELIIALITLFGVIFVELFVGVIAGLAAAVFKLVYTFSHLEIRRETSPAGEVDHLHLTGSATFVHLPYLAEELDKLPTDRRVIVHIDRLDHIDHACLELLSNLKQRREANEAKELVVEWDELTHRYENAVLGVGLRPTGPSRSLLSHVWGEWKQVYGFSGDPQAVHSVSGIVFDADHVVAQLGVTTLEDVIHTAAERLSSETGHSVEEIQTKLLQRADRHIVLGEGIIIPHTPLSGVERSHAVCVVTKAPVELFGAKGDIFFVMIAPEADPKQHLHALAYVGGLCHDKELLAGLRSANDARDAVLYLKNAIVRSEENSGHHDKERRLVVLECDTQKTAKHAKDILQQAFQQNTITVSGSESELASLLLPLIGAVETRVLVSTQLGLSEVAVLRALLDEQKRIAADRRVELHVLGPA